MIIQKAAVLFLAVLGGYGPCHAAASGGGEPLNFLFLDANARPVGMGGAYTALATDANALLYNPAGLGRIRNHEATFMHNQYFQGISQEYAAYASPYGLGANVNLFSFGRVQKTSLSNPDGDGMGVTSLTDLAASAGYGHGIGADMSLGLGVKYLRSSLAGITAQGFAADLGALYAVPAARGLTFGCAVQNIGPKIKFKNEQENLPLNVRFGSAYAFKLGSQRSVVSADVTKERSENVLFNGGFETIIMGMMAVRAGFNSRNDAGLGITAGVGWIYQKLSLDYAIVPYGDIGIAHRVSVTLRWGGSEPDSGRSLPVDRATNVVR